ncbi:hypothetical protein COCNU_scaffold003436G000010 [Cocos nucifera]|nr:hypothetical protein [Cocos nucifera]
MQQFPSFTQQQEQLLPHGLQASMVGNYTEPSTATCTDIHPPMLIPRGNVFSKINNQTGSQSVPKDQEMVLSTLEEEFTRKGKEPLYSTKDSSQPGDTVGPSNVASAILGGTPCPTSTSRIISECFGTTDKRMLDNSVKGGESFEISELMNEAMDADNGLAENNVESEPSPEADDD